VLSHDASVSAPGAVATQDIEAGHVLVKAPLDSVLMVSEADSCPLPEDFIDPKYWDGISEYWNLRMALRLLYEKRLGADSSWKAYLDVMPTSFTTPLNWSDEEVAQLQFLPFVDELQVCACAHVCVCACVCVCARVRVFVCVCVVYVNARARTHSKRALLIRIPAAAAARWSAPSSGSRRIVSADTCPTPSTRMRFSGGCHALGAVLSPQTSGQGRPPRPCAQLPTWC
jgi:hypothetical protein